MNRSALPFVVLGSFSIIAGGVISAASAGGPNYFSAWTVAYLVLVAGFAQLVLGIGQANLASRIPSTLVIAWQIITFNASSAAVLLGTLLAAPFLTYVGAALLVVALALFVWGVRGHTRHSVVLLWAFRTMVVILLVSAPIGLIISHSRMG
ncbi:hypothetical protein [Arthrobacter cryoconiti]|uniref:Uncharacterized protein n=1 Tax=Arthrobacter cryoconiti TaxID=748907 RepID=A0ABV8QWI2_9MICC|nr:hypothetical protein [Arthrobacter cryoconiti]MCC9069529.1 hypothetical protein [Arthrobacter cryoconiti]